MNLTGTTARVCANIPKGEEGEVMVSIFGGPQAFPARAYEEDGEFKEGDRVVVLEEQGRTLYVAKV